MVELALWIFGTVGAIVIGAVAVGMIFTMKQENPK